RALLPDRRGRLLAVANALGLRAGLLLGLLLSLRAGRLASLRLGLVGRGAARRRRHRHGARGSTRGGRRRLRRGRRSRLLEVGLQLGGALVVGLLLGRLLLGQPLQPLRVLLAGVVRQPERGEEEDR